MVNIKKKLASSQLYMVAMSEVPKGPKKDRLGAGQATKAMPSHRTGQSL